MPCSRRLPLPCLYAIAPLIFVPMDRMVQPLYHAWGEWGVLAKCTNHTALVILFIGVMGEM